MKFICEGCEKPCILDSGDYTSLDVADLRCVVKDRDYCKWEKYDDGKVANLQPEVAKLPKLTAEVFNRPDCPVWAKYAAVDKCRNAMWYEGEPKVGGSVFWNSQRGQIQKIPGKFDASDWQNSLIERPKNRVNWDDVAEILRNSTLTFKEKKQELPDWCKVGEWVWINGRPDRLAYNGYGKITQVEPYIDVLMGTDGNAPNTTISLDGLSQARLRPYNAEEMRGLVGKVVCGSEGKLFLVLSYSPNTVFFGGFSHTPEDLTLDIYKFPDGSPCGVLEHLEEGEWVK